MADHLIHRLWATATVAACFGLALGLAARLSGEPFPLDESLATLAQRLPADFGRAGSLPGDWRIAVPTGFLVAALAWRLGSATFMLAALIAQPARLLNPLWKELVERPRPGPDQLNIHEAAAGWGFPSGHASTAALTFGLLALLAATRLSGWRRMAVVAPALGVVVVAGVSRVVVGAHWPSDVIGGWLTGGAVALLIPAGVALMMRASSRVCGN